VKTKLGFGKPNRVIPELINAGFDILVMGTHGHTWIQGFDFGTTVNKLRTNFYSVTDFKIKLC
jgi:manganese transport protein